MKKIRSTAVNIAKKNIEDNDNKIRLYKS